MKEAEYLRVTKVQLKFYLLESGGLKEKVCKYMWKKKREESKMGKKEKLGHIPEEGDGVQDSLSCSIRVNLICFNHIAYVTE